MSDFICIYTLKELKKMYPRSRGAVTEAEMKVH